jgi:Leucine-rich repeat (LRR) protein
VESEELTVTRTPGTIWSVTVDIGTLPGLPANHSGYSLVKSDDLPLEVIEGLADGPVIWSGTMTVGTWRYTQGDGRSGTGYGYDSSRNSGLLSNRTFNYRGTTYRIDAFYSTRLDGFRPSSHGIIELNKGGPSACEGKVLEVKVNSTWISLNTHSDRAYMSYWPNPLHVNNTNWQSGQRLSVAIRFNPTVPESPDLSNPDISVDNQIQFSWTAPCDGGTDIIRYEYRQQTKDGVFGSWIPIPDSAVGGANATGYTVTNVSNPQESTFEVRAVNLLGPGSPSTGRIPGFIPVSERTLQVRAAIVAEVPGVNSASDVTATHLAAITRLSLDGRRIRALKTGDFDGLTSLTTFVLSNTPLSSLPAGIFDNLTALTSLYLSENQLSTLPAGIFDKLTTLTTLDLAENRLSLLPAGIFDKLSTLTKLELDLNQLSTLPAGIFDNLSALTFLNLFGNQLSTLPAGIFDNLTALTSLAHHADNA